MEFLRVVEEELRGLAAEARRRYPVVQEAAERAILKLRNMREEYAVALRQQHEGNAPPLSMFRSQDLLRPFLLACNHADASPQLMIMAMSSIQYLINRDAILPSDAPNILRVLAIQSQSKDADVQKRVLQTMVMVVTWKSCDMTEDTVAQALGVCLGLHDAKNAMVRTAADMTVRQIISLLFDRVADELGVTAAAAAARPPSSSSSNAAVVVAASGSTTVGVHAGFGADDGGVAGGDREAGLEEAVVEEEEGDAAGTGEGALRCAHLVFQDLCVLSRGEQGQWIKRTSVSASLGLELVEQVLSQQPVLFRRFKVLRRLLSQEVCPLILQTLRRRMNFPLLVRLLKAASTLTVTYGDLLPNEAHAILSTMLSSLGTGLGSEVTPGGERDGDGAMGFSPSDDDGAGGCVSWAAVLTLEAVHRILSNSNVVLELFRHGGREGRNSNGTVVEEMLHAVSQHLARNLNSQADVHGLDAMALSIRLGRVGSPSSSSASPGEGKRLPLPPCLTTALARESENDDRASRAVAGAPPSSSSRSGGGGGGGSDAGGKNTRTGAGTIGGGGGAGGRVSSGGAGGWSSTSSGGSGGGGGGGNVSGTRSSSSELLHETEAPQLEDAELLLWALQCIVDLAAAMASLVDGEFGTSDTTVVLPSSAGLVPGESPPKRSRRETLKKMCEALWEPMLSSLSHVLVHCSDPLVVSTAVDGYKAFSVAAGVLGVEDAVDGFVGSLCRFSLPQWHGNDVIVGGGGTGGGGQGGSSPALSWSHVGTLEGVLQVVHRLGNLLRGSWHVVLDTLEQAAGLLGRRAIAPPRWSPQSPETELAEVERHCADVLLAAERLVEFSTCLEDEALYTLMSSLQALAVVDLANTSTVLPQERTTAREREAAAQAQANGVSGEGRGAGAAAVAAASGLVSFVGAAARGVGAAMSEGREAMTRDHRSSSSSNITINSAKGPRGTGDAKAHVPWVSSRLVVECAVANTWRLPVVWELVSGHLRVVAKAREPAKREYAVRALRELIVDGVQRLHPAPSPPSADTVTNGNPNSAANEGGTTSSGAVVGGGSFMFPPPPSSNGAAASSSAAAAAAGAAGATGTSAMTTTTTTTPGTTPRARAVNTASSASAGALRTSAPPTSSSGGGGQEEGFLPTFLGLRARLEGAVGGGDDAPFRWVFDCESVGGVFSAGRGGEGTRRMTTRLDGGGEAFEGVLFKTMGLFALTPHVDTREATLQTLFSILQSCGQALDSAWPVILDLLHSVARGATDAAVPPSPRTPRSAPFGAREGEHAGNDSGGGGGEHRFAERGEDDGESGAETRPVVWGGACLSLAFKCLQLVVDDFLERVPRDQVPKLVTCAGAFGGQTESVNLSLTAIGMLWTVCDTFSDATTTTPAGGVGEEQGGGFSLSSSASSRPPEARSSLQSMWPTMLFQLRSLAVDFRPELRNCAVNTLFSAAVGNGDGLSEADWKQFLLEVTFPLMEQVLESTNSASSGANTAVAPELKKGVRMLMHHTRDTDQKQWNETRVLAMQGLGRVLRAYVTVLARYDWFSTTGGVWTKSLGVYRDACLAGSDSQEVSLGGVDGITTMVLLVGRMGLKSVQVRAGAGMKIVDGTLQKSQIAKPGAAPGQDADAAAMTTPEFAAVRPALYKMAWGAMVEASGFKVDESGDIAPAFVEGLAAVYKAGVEEGAELSAGQEGEEERMRQLFEMLDGLFPPRVLPAAVPSGGGGGGRGSRRPVYVPKVTPGQRAILDFLQDDLRSGWQLAVRLLAKYSVAGEVEGDAGGGSGVGGGSAATALGPGGVSAECVKEAATALSSIMSKGRVPTRDRGLALEGLLSEVSGPCIRRLESLRKVQQQERSQRHSGAGALEAPGGVDLPSPFSTWPAEESYSEVMRLLLALLRDGLPCVSEPAPPPASAIATSQDQQDERLAKCLRGAIEGIGAVAECRRLKLGFLAAQDVVEVESAGQVVGGGRTGGVGSSSSCGGSRVVSAAAGSEGPFSQLLCEALVLVTGAVRAELVPLVCKGSASARDVARAFIDSLGAFALSAVDAPPLASPPEARRSSSRSGGDSISTGGDGNDSSSASAANHTGAATAADSASLEAFGFAVEELSRMCGEDGGVPESSAGGVPGGGWTLLGLPLRRRACWHLLRCVWSTTRRFRSLEDELSAFDSLAVSSRRWAEERGCLEASLVLTADRCTCALNAAGKVLLPPSLLTPRFKKLVATKQAEENNRLPTAARASASPASTSAPTSASSWTSPSAANGHGRASVVGDGGGVWISAASEDVEWASMAEEEQQRGDGGGSSSSGGRQSANKTGGVEGDAGSGGGAAAQSKRGDTEDEEDEEAGSARRAGQQHLILVCRALLACSTSKMERVRKSAERLLADADIPGALDALQDEVASLKRALRQREAQLTRKDKEVSDLRAQVAAGSFM